MYPEVEPHDQGFLEVGDGNRVYWETCGNPRGKPAVVFHGGPGSGCSPWFRSFFDPDAYRLVLFDQRNCGRSTPHASDPDTDLSANTTWRLVADAELLREQLEIERWLVFGGSWGSTLGLTYSVTHTDRITEIVLSSVTTGRHEEFDWLFRGRPSALLSGAVGAPTRRSVPEAESDPDVVDAYSALFVRSGPFESGGTPPSSGACGNPRRPPGRRRRSSLRGSAIPTTRSRSRESWRTTCAPTPGWRTAPCSGMPASWPTSRVCWSAAATTSRRPSRTRTRSGVYGHEPSS